jgi:hypothetical protein
MAATPTSTSNLVTLARLHAALDSVVEIEQYVAEVRLPLHKRRTSDRLVALATEMRGLLAGLVVDSAPRARIE